MPEPQFRLTPPGQMSRHATVYTLSRMAIAYYDSLRGLLSASYIGLDEDGPPELMEDGSLAPWTKLRARVQWPHGIFEETIVAARLIPSKARLRHNRIAAFRWRLEEK